MGKKWDWKKLYNKGTCINFRIFWQLGNVGLGFISILNSDAIFSMVSWWSQSHGCVNPAKTSPQHGV